jgi:preprotein translocase subunit SecG
MTTLFIILIILTSALLGIIVLIQNPKGGGLSGTIAGFSNQFMGVKQTTDVLEKGTWVLSAVLVVLCLVSSLVINSTKDSGTDAIKNIPTTTSPNSLPQQQATPPVLPAAPSEGTGK